jgi:hypothetical protein
MECILTFGGMCISGFFYLFFCSLHARGGRLLLGIEQNFGMHTHGK